MEKIFYKVSVTSCKSKSRFYNKKFYNFMEAKKFVDEMSIYHPDLIYEIWSSDMFINLEN